MIPAQRGDEDGEIPGQLTFCEANQREDWQLVDCDPVNESVTYRCRLCGAVTTVNLKDHNDVATG